MTEPADFVTRVRMVDVGDKPETRRESVAKGVIRMQPSSIAALQRGEMFKGDVLATAQVAGILGAKNTSQIIPMCHPLLLSDVRVELHPDEEKGEVGITATARCEGKTGVEMEALTAVTISALTIYDMCKGVDQTMCIQNIRLVRKSGGKSGTVELE